MKLDLDELRAAYDHPADKSVIELIDRLELAEQAVQRVREVMAEWDTDEDSKGLHLDITRALDSDGRRCLECNGTGDVQVRFNHGIQTQDCAVCFGTGDGRG